jgi:hypothetical protein
MRTRAFQETNPSFVTPNSLLPTPPTSPTRNRFDPYLVIPHLAPEPFLILGRPAKHRWRRFLLPQSSRRAAIELNLSGLLHSTKHPLAVMTLAPRRLHIFQGA